MQVARAMRAAAANQIMMLAVNHPLKSRPHDMSVCHEKRHRDRERERLRSVGRNNCYTHAGACWGRYTLEFGFRPEGRGGGVARASYPKGGRELCTCDSARRTHYGTTGLPNTEARASSTARGRSSRWRVCLCSCVQDRRGVSHSTALKRGSRGSGTLR